MSIDDLDSPALATTGLKEMMETHNRREELDPELESYVEETSSFGPWVKHPLCFMMLGNKDEATGIYPFAAAANEAFRAKSEGLVKAVEDRNWFAVLHVFYERPHRLEGFMEYEDQYTDEEYWELLGNIWTDTENAWQCELDWHEAFESKRDFRHKLMDDDELSAFRQMPDELVVYRGYCRDGRENGMAWTTDKERAEWFARRFAREDEGHHARVATGLIPKGDAYAYFTGRGESEVLCPIDAVMDIHVERLR